MELHFQNWYVTRLRESVDAHATTIFVDRPPEINSGILVLESGVANKREIIYFSGKSGFELTGVVRGLEGTTPNSHNQGATVEQSVTAGQMDQVLSPHILLQGLGNDENAAMSQAAVTRVITNSHNTDGSLKDNVVSTAKIADNAVTADKVDFTTLLPDLFTGFGDSISSDTNPGSAGGSRNWLNLGGIKIAWGITSDRPTKSSPIASTITLPSNFFSSITTALLTPANMSLDARASAAISNIATTQLSIYTWNPANGGYTQVAWLVVGK